MGRTMPTYCEECGKLADAGDFGGIEDCDCTPLIHLLADQYGAVRGSMEHVIAQLADQRDQYRNALANYDAEDIQTTDHCAFCGGDLDYDEHLQIYVWDHADDCAWVAAQQHKDGS